jgi:Kef-type K+ transport system membrane component KefB
MMPGPGRLLAIAILFIFLGIGEYAEATALGAILAGVGLKTFIPDERLKIIENEIKAVCYGLFAPIFSCGQELIWT